MFGGSEHGTLLMWRNVEEIYSADSTLRKKAYSRDFYVTRHLYNVEALYEDSFYGLTRRASSSKWYSFLVETCRSTV